jgi:hypothetical protein
MIFYDYSKIWILSGGESKHIVRYFQAIVNKAPGYKFLVGHDYIINESIVVKNQKKLNARVLAEYLGLCALRPYSVYKFYNNKDIYIDRLPRYVPKKVIQDCPFITIDLEINKVVFEKEQ